jgi:hypothetical protein
LTKTSKEPAQPGLFDQPKVKFVRSRYDASVPIGRWMIQVPESYLAGLHMDMIDRYILEEHRASPGSLLSLRWYRYSAETVRILKCQTWEAYQDEVDGIGLAR